MVVSLFPPELGQVDVSVTTRGKRVEIEMATESVAAKSVIESGLSDLKQSMQAQDLFVSKLEVHTAREISQSFESAFTTLAGDSQFQRFAAFREPPKDEPPIRGRIPMIGPVSVAAIGMRDMPSGRLDLRI